MPNSERGVRVFVGRSFLAKNAPFSRPENGEEKVLPDLGFLRSSIFVTARFFGRFWAVNSESCIGCVSAGSGCAFLYGITYLIQGVLLSCRSRDSGAAVLGFVFLLLSSSSFVLLRLPPFSSWGRLGFSSLPPSCVLAGPQRLGGRQVRAAHGAWHVCLSFFLPLSARAGSSLPFPVFLSLSLSLSLFACLSESLSVSVSQQGCIWIINTAIIFAVLHHTWIPVEILGPIQVTYLTFGD